MAHREWQGPRLDNAEYFDEYMNRGSAEGIFEGTPGADVYDRVHMKPHAEGILVQTSCKVCGKYPLNVVFEWRELAFLGSNLPNVKPVVLAQGWLMRQDRPGVGFHPVRCGKCGGEAFTMALTVPQAREEIKKALTDGRLPLQFVQGWEREAQQIRAQAGG